MSSSRYSIRIIKLDVPAFLPHSVYVNTLDPLSVMVTVYFRLLALLTSSKLEDEAVAVGSAVCVADADGVAVAGVEVPNVMGTFVGVGVGEGEGEEEGLF